MDSEHRVPSVLNGSAQKVKVIPLVVGSSRRARTSNHISRIEVITMMNSSQKEVRYAPQPIPITLISISRKKKLVKPMLE